MPAHKPSPPRRKYTSEEAQAIADKVEADIGVAFGTVSRLAKAAIKVTLQPKIETAKKLLRAVLED